MRRVLLLGATGFIGARVLNALRRDGGVRVMALGHRRVPYRSLEDVDLVVDSLTRFDLSWIDRFEPDTVIHAARLGGRGRLARSIASRRGRRANQRLVDWLTAHAREVKVVYVSGTLVYGDRGEAEADESTSLQPTAYAREYLTAEVPWIEAARGGALRVTMVRPPWVVGPGSWLGAHYVAPSATTGVVPLYGAGANWMSFLDVDDCAGAIVHLARIPDPPDVVNLFAPGQRARQREFVEALAEMLRRRVEPVPVSRPRPYRDRAVGEALTTSFKAATLHGRALTGYEWIAPTWGDMLARHVAAA